MYKSLANKLIKTLEPVKNELTTINVVVPIKAIDDVPVDVKITFGLAHQNVEPGHESKIYKLWLTIWSEEAYADNEDEDYEIRLWESKHYSVDLIEIGIEFVLEKIFNQVRELKFDKLTGTFKPKDEMEDLVEMYKFLETMPNVKLAFEECCVCHDPTQTQTCCGHKLCRKCMFSIKPVRNEEYQWSEINCPICRQTIGTR
jgi:hypothetical protein